MRISTHTEFYPIFRLLLPLGVGIGGADVFFQGRLSDVSLLWAIGLLPLLMLMANRWQGYRYRWLFGGLTFLFFSCVGAWLVQHERKQVRYEWPSERQVYQGVICDLPQEKAKTYLCKIKVGHRMEENKRLPVDRTLFIYIVKDSLSKRLQCGDSLQFYTRVSVPLTATIPGEFDYARYLFRQQISGTAVVYSGSWQKIGRRAPLSFRQRAVAYRQQILNRYRDWGFSGDELAVLSALTVGYKDDLTSALKETYQQAGVSHVLALSGMHVAILWGLLSGLLQLLGRGRIGRWIKCAILVVSLIGFAFLTGLSPSVVRAVGMCLLLSVAQADEHPSYSLNTLGVIAFGMLLYHPFYLFDVGFQLSFMAVFSIVVVSSTLLSRFQVRYPVLRSVWSLVLVSLAAQLGTAPLVMYYFSHFPVYFLLANLIVAPLVFLILYGALAIFVCASVPMVHGWLVKAVDMLLQWLNGSMRWVEQLPYAGEGAWHLSLAEVYAGYFLVVMGWRYYCTRSRRSLIGWGIAVNLFLGIAIGKAFFHTEPSGLLLTRAQVRAFPATAMWQQDSIYHYKGITVCLLADDRWHRKEADEKLDIDYLYVCRGYKGRLENLQSLFRIKTVVLDTSLSAYRIKRAKEECDRLKIPYIDLFDKGSYRIIP